MALAMWPFIPIFFIPLHYRTEFWRRIGLLTYPLLIVPWLIVASLVYLNQSMLLGRELELPIVLGILGWICFICGILLHTWTAKLLGIGELTGYAELKPSGEYRLITSGPFSVVRHPTYLAHTLVFVGVFLLTGYAGAGLLALLDFIVSYFVITSLEERELVRRFGEEYQEYRRRVPKFFPGIR